MTTQPPATERFYANVEYLVDLAKEASIELTSKNITSLSETVISMAALVIGALPRTKLINTFIDNGEAECWDNVADRNDQFFLSHADRLFGRLQGFKLNIFQDVFRKDESGQFILSKVLIDDVWDTLGAMIKISINYIHQERRPIAVAGDNGVFENCYRNDFYSDINIAGHAEMWKVTLYFPKG
jgi:hypothetical protein